MQGESESQQSQNLLVKLGLVRLQRPEPRQNPNSQCLLGSWVFLVKLGLSERVPRRNLNSQRVLVELDGTGSSWSRAGGTTRVVEVPKISCQGKVDKIMKSFTGFCERFGCEAAVAVGESVLFSVAVRDGF